MRRRLSTIMLALLAALWAGPSSAVQIEAFTAADRPVQGARQIRALGARVTVYRVDDIARINAILSIGLPRDAGQAAKVAMARIEANQALIKRRYEHCAKGLLRAAAYRLDRYPAVVLDGAAVVYGVTDLQEVMAHYRRWRGASR